MTEHLDLDALADVLAGEPAPPHLAGCAQCSAELAELRAADARVTAALQGLPEPALPADLPDRLAAALAREGRGSATGVTTLPAARSRRPARWLPAAAAAVLVLGGGAYALTQVRAGSDGSSDSSAAAGTAASAAPLVRNSTGTDYSGRTDLAAAVPRLLTGAAVSAMAPAPAAGAGGSGGPAHSDSSKVTTGTTGGSGSVAGPMRAAGADPLARLRTDPGLADCLAAVLPADDPSVRPLALDYAQFRGHPALVIVLPGTSEKSLDVFVVGPGCSRADDRVLFYASVPAS